MVKLGGLALCCAALLAAGPVAAGIITCVTPSGAISCTGSLSSPEDEVTEQFALASSATITVQTYGFGGGTNAAGTTISPGGFDSLVALFSGSPTSATLLTDTSGNPLASADTLSPYDPGCPPAGLVTVGSVPGVCGDNQLTATLGAGIYTLLLTDANFVPLAVNPGAPYVPLGPYNLTDTTSGNYGSSTGNGAYTDLTGGVFQTCVDWEDCNTDTADFAVDITGLPSPAVATPEPGTLSLIFLGTGLAWATRRRRRSPVWVNSQRRTQ
jgi:hypothetical protein